jgi:uncharacterized protein (DUF2141 family)
MTMLKAATACAAAFALLAPALASAETCQNPPTGFKLTIFVDNVDAAKGQMTSSLYPGDKSQFLIKNGALKVWRAPATAPVTRMCIWLRGPGTYALAVYHDANSNGKWDHSLLGKIEGFGFSRNPHTLFSAPSYEQVKFDTTGAETILHVRLRYP